MGKDLYGLDVGVRVGDLGDDDWIIICLSSFGMPKGVITNSPSNTQR